MAAKLCTEQVIETATPTWVKITAPRCLTGSVVSLHDLTGSGENAVSNNCLTKAILLLSVAIILLSNKYPFTYHFMLELKCYRGVY